MNEFFKCLMFMIRDGHHLIRMVKEVLHDDELTEDELQTLLEAVTQLNDDLIILKADIKSQFYKIGI